MSNKETLSPIQQEILNRADSIFASISSTVGAGVELAKEQLPDIALQYIMFGRGYTSILMVLALVLLVVAYHCAVRVGIKDKYKMGDSELRIIIAILGGIVSAFIGTLMFFMNLKEFILVWFAPKIWIIQEIVHLVKRM